MKIKLKNTITALEELGMEDSPGDTELAASSGLSRNCINLLYNPDYTPKLDTVCCLIKGLYQWYLSQRREKITKEQLLGNIRLHLIDYTELDKKLLGCSTDSLSKINLKTVGPKLGAKQKQKRRPLEQNNAAKVKALVELEGELVDPPFD